MSDSPPPPPPGAGGSSDQWPALGQSFGPLSPASWGQVSSAAAQRAVQIQQAASAEQMSHMVAQMRTIAHDAAATATRAVMQEPSQPSLSPKPGPCDTAHHAATSAHAPAPAPAPAPGSLGDDLGALPVAPSRQLGAHDLGRSLKTALSQFSTTDSWPIYRDDFLAHLTTVNPVLVAVLLGARPPAHGLTAESFSLLQQRLSATLTVVMKSHPTAATRLRNLRRSDTFAAADNPGTLAWDQLCTHLDRRGVARTVRHLLALQQPQSPSEDQGAFTQRMLNAYHELNDSHVSLHSNVLHENVLVAATLAGMHNTVARDTILSALDAAETRAEDISYGRLCDMMHRHPTTPDSKPTRPGQDVAAFAAAMHTQLHSQVEAAVVAAMARAPPPARPPYARPPRGGQQNNARQHPPTTPCRICESKGKGKRFHWHAHCPLNQAPAAPTAAPPPAPAIHQAVVPPVSAASEFSDELSHMMAFLGNPDIAAPNAMMAHAGPSGIHASRSPIRRRLTPDLLAPTTDGPDSDDGIDVGRELCRVLAGIGSPHGFCGFTGSHPVCPVPRRDYFRRILRIAFAGVQPDDLLGEQRPGVRALASLHRSDHAPAGRLPVVLLRQFRHPVRHMHPFRIFAFFRGHIPSEAEALAGVDVLADCGDYSRGARRMSPATATAAWTAARRRDSVLGNFFEQALLSLFYAPPSSIEPGYPSVLEMVPLSPCSASGGELDSLHRLTRGSHGSHLSPLECRVIAAVQSLCLMLYHTDTMLGPDFRQTDYEGVLPEAAWPTIGACFRQAVDSDQFEFDLHAGVPFQPPTMPPVHADRGAES
eukprot:jgi/Tetstr1/462967/TSEL_007915.t1